MRVLRCELNGLNAVEKKIPSLSAARVKEIEAQLKTWLASDFAGFRRVLDAKSAEAPDFKAIEDVVKKHRQGSTGKTIEVLVVLGTGGSSLGTETIARALCPAARRPLIQVYDNNDPSFFSQAFAQWNAETTLFYVVSKSGSTPETLSQFAVVRAWLLKNLPKANADWRQHVVLCTDPVKGDLRKLAQSEGLSCLSVPSAVGGRFSVLTPVGLFPAMFAGLSGTGFIEGARQLAEELEAQSLERNTAFRLAQALVADPARNITVLMPYSSHLQTFSRWFSQLWAESLGKQGKGFTPYPALGTTDQHSQVQLYMEGPRDKIIGLMSVAEPTESLPLEMWDSVKDLSSFKELSGRTMQELFHAEFLATRDALIQEGVPVFCLEIPRLNEQSLGALFYWWEIVTAYAGAILQVNPFDQPGVELGKKLTKEYLRRSAVAQ